MKLLAASAFVLAAATTGAFAADAILPVTPIYEAEAVAADWSGFYVGVFAGYAAATSEYEIDDTEQTGEGWLLGAQAGYDWQMDQMVFGLATDIAWSGVTAGDDNGDPGDTLNWLGTTTARVGLALDSVLLYGKAGVAYGEATGYVGDEGATNLHVGWTAGLGAEVMVTDTVSLFAEYDYVDLGTQNYDFPVAGIDTDASITAHVGKIGINARF